jgi:hypothetical protein
MKVKARWKKIGLNPFKLRFSPKDIYYKTVEVPDDQDMDELKKFAIKDTMEGYEFVGLEVIDTKQGGS